MLDEQEGAFGLDGAPTIAQDLERVVIAPVMNNPLQNIGSPLPGTA